MALGGASVRLTNNGSEVNDGKLSPWVLDWHCRCRPLLNCFICSACFLSFFFYSAFFSWMKVKKADNDMLSVSDTLLDRYTFLLFYFGFFYVLFMYDQGRLLHFQWWNWWWHQSVVCRLMNTDTKRRICNFYHFKVHKVRWILELYVNDSLQLNQVVVQPLQCDIEDLNGTVSH